MTAPSPQLACRAYGQHLPAAQAHWLPAQPHMFKTSTASTCSLVQPTCTAGTSAAHPPHQLPHLGATTSFMSSRRCMSSPSCYYLLASVCSSLQPTCSMSFMGSTASTLSRARPCRRSCRARLPAEAPCCLPAPARAPTRPRSAPSSDLDLPAPSSSPLSSPLSL